MSIKDITHSNLANFYGSENVYFLPMFKSIKYTEGVRFIVHNDATWLVTDILSHVCYNEECKEQEFIVAKLKVNKDKTATLTLDDGNGNILTTQEYSFTDFPIPEISFYIEGPHGYKVMMLPSER